MSRALFVSLNVTYPQIAHAHRNYDSEALRNCTSMAWAVNPESAANVAYVFGVAAGRIVAAYSVAVTADNWPVLPEPAEGAGRRVLPVTLLPSSRHWDSALALTPGSHAESIPLSGPIRYGDVVQDVDGYFIAVKLDP